MAKANKNRLAINMLSYALLQVVNLLVGLILPRLYLEAYDSEVNGVISTINSFTSYFTYLEAGLGLTLIHSLFKPLAENNKEELNGILSYSKKRYQKISLIYLILVIVFSLLFPLTKKTQDLDQLEFTLLIFVIGLYGALDFFTMAKYRVLLTADRKEYVISLAMTVAQLVRFVFVWLLLRLDLSVVLVKIVPILTLFIRYIILQIYVKKKYKDVSFNSANKVSVETSKGHWDALLLQISISTSIAIPTILISQILDYKEANVYAVYGLVISAMISITSSLSSGVSPMLGKDISEGKNILKTYQIFDFFVGVVIAVVFSIAVVMFLPFVKMYTNVVDDVNYIRPIYAVLMCVWGALYTYRIPITAVINAAGIYKPNRVHNIINLVLQVVLGVVATIFFGAIGLMVVMIISALQRNISLTVVNNKVLLKASIKNCILYQLLIVAVIVGSFFATYNFISGIEFNLFKWIWIALVVAVVEIVLCVGIFSLINIKTCKATLLLLKLKLSRGKTKATAKTENND